MIIAVDFDGTVVEHCFPSVGEDVPGAVETLKELVAAGHKLILWTIRADGSEKHPKCLQHAKNWYASRGIPLWGVNKNPSQKYWSASPKAHADIFIDDMALGCPMTRFRKDGDYLSTDVVDWKVVRNTLALKGAFDREEAMHATGI